MKANPKKVKDRREYAQLSFFLSFFLSSMSWIVGRFWNEMGRAWGHDDCSVVVLPRVGATRSYR